MPNDKAFSEMNSWNSDWGDEGVDKVCNILYLKVNRKLKHISNACNL